MENTINKKVKLGEIYYYDFGETVGSVQNGRRPVIVVQCDEANRTSPTTIVAAISTAIYKRYNPSHIYIEENCGLRENSIVMLEQIRTVQQSELFDYVGKMTDEHNLKVLGNALKTVFGLWRKRPDEAKNVRCLCSRCLNDYKANSDYIIRRYNPYNKVKSQCDKCFGQGYDYIITERKR